MRHLNHSVRYYQNSEGSCPSEEPGLLTCLSFHTRMNVSNTTSAACDTTWEISRPMSRGFVNMLLRLRLRDSATIALVFLFTS
jgi:hypothetical protein